VTILPYYCYKYIDNNISSLCVLCRHLQRKHREQHKKYLADGQATKPLLSQGNILLFVDKQGSDTFGPNHPQQVKFVESLTENLIVACGLPISVVDKPEFQSFIHDLNPKLSIPTRQSLTYKILPQLADSRRTVLLNALAKANQVALTLDIWTDRACHSFLAITAHTFHDCTPLSGLLTFCSFTGSHTGARIAEEIQKAIVDNHLENKVAFIVTDNASNMKRAFDVLTELQQTDIEIDDQAEQSDDGPSDESDEGILDDDTLWEDVEDIDSPDGDIHKLICKQCTSRLPCFAHSLQLVVKDGLAKLNTSAVRHLTAKCTKLCNMVHQSAVFRDAFEAQFGVGRSLPKANDTRWNSTFHHLQSIANLDQNQLASLLRTQNQQCLIMTKKEVNILQELLEILQPFAEATDLTQGEQYPTIGCIIPSVVALDRCLQDLSTCTVHHTAVVKALRESLRRRFLGLFQRIMILPITDNDTQPAAATFGSEIYLLSSLLDPSYGLLWLEDHTELTAVKQNLKDSIIGKHRNANFLS